MDGQDVIGHLMDVEREANSMLADAQAEADRRKHAASDEASREYKEGYEKLVASLERELESGKAEIDRARKAELDAYRAHLESIPRDSAAFCRYLDSLLADS